ncbi:MAG: glycosyltransferase [Chthoniobacterales bacterium]
MSTCIALSTDHNYIPQTCLTVCSYALSNPTERADIHVLIDETVTGEDRDLLSRTADVFSLRLRIVPLESTWKSRIPERFLSGWSHVSPVAFAKLLAIDLLPSDYDRCLILDTDLLVVGSLQRLCSMSLEGYPIAAVRDFMMPESSGKRLSLSRPETYFNSGVLLVDRVKWNNADPLNRIASMDEALLSRLSFLEQDILNIIFEVDYLELSPCFNNMIMVALSGEIPNPGDPDRIPVIHHFPGQIKPWHEYSPRRVQGLYLQYANVCRWIGMTLKAPSNTQELRLAATLSRNLGNQALFAKYSQLLSQSN